MTVAIDWQVVGMVSTLLGGLLSAGPVTAVAVIALLLYVGALPTHPPDHTCELAPPEQEWAMAFRVALDGEEWDLRFAEGEYQEWADAGNLERLREGGRSLVNAGH